MATQILQIQSSIFGGSGVSSQLSKSLMEGLKSSRGAIDLKVRDVSTGEIPHFDAQTIQAISENSASLADQLIEEVKSAEVIIVSAPMYNFAIPSQLKSWFDHIARAQVTFKYTENGPVGLLNNKEVYVIHARGGQHQGKATDTETAYLDTMLGFLGMTDVNHIYAEGLNMGEETRTKSIEAAENHIQALFKQEELAS